MAAQVALSILVVISIFYSVFSCFDLLMEVVERLSAPFYYAWSRELDQLESESTLSVVYMPLFSGGAAIAAGFGVNLITNDNQEPVMLLVGAVYVIGTLIALAGGGLWLVKHGPPGRALRRRRNQLRAYAQLVAAPPDYEQALAFARRNERIGQLMIQQADALTVRRWIRIKGIVTVFRSTLYSFPTLCAIPAIVWINGKLPPSERATAEVSELSLVFLVAILASIVEAFVGPLAALMQRSLQCWRRRTIGEELAMSARQAIDNLNRYRPAAPSVSAPRRQSLWRWWSDRPWARRM